MKKPSSLHSRNWLRTARHPSRVSRARPRQRPLRFEALEGRAMLSLTQHMVLDINTSTLYSSQSGIVAIGSTTYFAANDGVHGIELWKSDGTANGTVLVADINPGSSSEPRYLTNVNGTLFFVAND